jgi:threonine dehydratase
MKICPRYEDIVVAHSRIQKFIHRTPIITNSTLNQLTGAKVYLKSENFQEVGAFKFRGAMNAILNLSSQEKERGVVTHSSGNHAQALAKAAAIHKIPAFIVMPSNTPQVKKAAVEGYLGQITYCEPTLESRESTVARILERTSATFIHPYNNSDVIAGQGTAALELLQEISGLDAILVPVGGGGLLSGTAIAAKGSKAAVQVIGVEPEMADDAFRSFRDGIIHPSKDPCTIADGLLTSLGDLTFPIIRKNVDKMVTVSEDEIKFAMRFIWERLKIIIEPSAAVPVAAILSKKVDTQDRRIGIILSGGNVDLQNSSLWFGSLR